MARAIATTLLLAAGKLLGIALGEARELDHGEGSIDGLGPLLTRNPAHAQAEGDIVGHRQVREEREVLEDHREIAAIGRGLGDAGVANEDVALVRRLEAGDQAQRRSCRSRRGPSSEKNGAARNGERERLDRDGLAVALGDALEADIGGAAEPESDMRFNREVEVALAAPGFSIRSRASSSSSRARQGGVWADWPRRRRACPPARRRRRRGAGRHGWTRRAWAGARRGRR